MRVAADEGRAASGRGPAACDLLIHNGHVLTQDRSRTIHPRGAIAVIGSRIAAVGPEDEILAAYAAPEVVDAGGAPVHPGFIDAHVHVTQHTARGFDALLARNPGTTANFAQWKAELGDEDERASVALAGLDLLRHGFTGFVEGGTAFSPDAAAGAAEAIGIRAWLADPYLWDSADIMSSVPRLMSPRLAAKAPFSLDRCLRELGTQLRRNRDPDALVRGFVALYGAGTASDRLQLSAKEVANRHGVVCAQHVGYVPSMTELEEARLGRPCLVHLDELGVLDRNSHLVHLNVLRDAEIEPLVASGARVVWCPANYLFHAAREGARGRMPELLRRGVPIALGSDMAKNCTPGECGSLAVHAAGQSGASVPAPAILDMLTLGGARAIGAEDELGSLEPGKRADIVVRRDLAPDAQPCLDVVFQVAVLGRDSSVDTVIVDGRIVLRDGRSTRVEASAVYRDARASVAGLMARLGLRA